jgi:AraC family transcriptional regulator of adaptative response / DNA-3-methyladenine glycosylase II
VERDWHHVDLPYRPPLAWQALVDFLAARAVPGVEEVVDGVYRRVLRLPGGPGVVELSHRPDGAGGGSVACRLRLTDVGDRSAAVASCRRLLDLDADPAAVDGALGGDPALAAAVRAAPGRRSPASVDALELAFRAVLGQQVTLAAARALAGELAGLCGDPLAHADGGLRRAFPSATAVAGADLDRLGMPGSRRATLRALGTALADGDIRLQPRAPGDPPSRGADDRPAVESALLRVRGIGPWTAAYVVMRGLADPDVFLPGDAGVRRALGALGLADVRTGDRWRPWRSYAVHHLWAGLG